MTRSIISSTATYMTEELWSILVRIRYCTNQKGIKEYIMTKKLYAIHYTILHNTTLYNTIQYNTLQYNTILYNTIQYCSERTLEGATASIRGLDLDTLDIRFNLCVWKRRTHENLRTIIDSSGSSNKLSKSRRMIIVMGVRRT